MTSAHESTPRRGESRTVVRHVCLRQPPTDPGHASLCRHGPGPRRPAGDRGEGYDAHNALAEADLSGASYRLFHKMCALQNRKDHGLVRVETQVKFAEQVGMSQSSVSRALRQLAAAGFIYPDGRDWRIRPDFVFNGNGAAQGQAVQNIPADAPDPYTGKGVGPTVIDGGNSGDSDGA